MITRITAAGLACAFAVAASATGFAADTKCGSFSLRGGEKVIDVVDNPPRGPSPGDVRAGNRQLIDDGGDGVAVVHFSATLTALPTATSGSTFASQYFVKFADGWIATSSVYELADAKDTSQRAGDAVLLVSGGTGAFENATGTIEIEAGDPPTYVFDLTCE
jgi:hypothetical protein